MRYGLPFRLVEPLARDLLPLEPQLDGSHLLWLWQRLVDQYIFWPWYPRARAARVVGGVPLAGLARFLDTAL